MVRFVIIFVNLWLFLFIFWKTDVEAAQRKILSPARIATLRKMNMNFFQCQKGAVDLYKSKKIDKVTLFANVTACQERFPGATLYTTCKKNILSQKDLNKKYLNENLTKCKRYLIAASFDPERPIPVFVKDDRIFFAGIGLNDALFLNNLDPPNFTCNQIKDVIQNPNKGEFFLFGNHPRVFTDFIHSNYRKYLQPIEIRHDGEKETVYNIDGFGRLYGKIDDENSMVFFPTVACPFSGNLGNSFTGLTIYYLVDKEKNMAIPYVGVAFYKKDAQLTDDLVTKTLVNTLGEETESNNQSKNITFYAKAEISEFDKEGDPKNVCRKLRKYDFIAAVKHREEEEAITPEYLLIANIKNLCRFGDDLAQRLAKRQ